MRRHDSGWRDTRLNLVHSGYGIDVPAPGMSLVMVEYDRGEALAVINYVRRDVALPTGPKAASAYRAMGNLRSPIGVQMPFITVRYDPRNWAMELFPHNAVARDLLGTNGWLRVTELHFVRLLYRLRGRSMPDLVPFSVELATAPWLGFEGQQKVTSWPGQDMSVRRRGYEPEAVRGGVVVNAPFNMRNPCADVDLALLDRAGNIGLFVDFKLEGAAIEPKHPTHRAMSRIVSLGPQPVPSVICRYEVGGGDGKWRFHVWALNEAAEELVWRTLVSAGTVPPSFRVDGWTYMCEADWNGLLDVAGSGRV